MGNPYSHKDVIRLATELGETQGELKICKYDLEAAEAKIERLEMMNRELQREIKQLRTTRIYPRTERTHDLP